MQLEDYGYWIELRITKTGANPRFPLEQFSLDILKEHAPSVLIVLYNGQKVKDWPVNIKEVWRTWKWVNGEGITNRRTY